MIINTYKPYPMLLIAAVTAWLSACQPAVMYQNQQAVSSDGWHYTDSVLFEVNINDTVSLHEMYLDIRNTTDYAYSNLFVFLDIIFPDGRILRDTLECILADKHGQWTGRGFGAIRTNRFLFRDDVWFPAAGTYAFIMTHGMRDESLTGIADVGLRIEKKQ